MMEFPAHLIYEIRVRLPAKSLVRFRCMARTWDNITQDPYLAHKQLQLYPTHLQHSPSSMLCLTKFEYEKPGSINHVASKLSCYGIQMWVPGHYKFNGACSGWFCFEKRDPYNPYLPDLTEQSTFSCPLLYNPLTQQTRHLPPLTLNNIDANYSKLYGLGFDANTHLFKLFSIVVGDRLNFCIFTQNSWRTMELPGSPVYGRVASTSHSVFLNGVVHCHLELENPKRQVIVAFDVHKEEVKFIAFPPAAIHPKGLWVLSKLGGRLAIFEYPDNRSRDSFNVHMQLINPGGGGGGGGEWNVEHRITRHQVDCRFGVSGYVHLYPPATCDYQVIIERGGQLVIAYDIRTRKMRMLPMPSMFYFTTIKLLHSLHLTLLPLNGFIES